MDGVFNALRSPVWVACRIVVITMIFRPVRRTEGEELSARVYGQGANRVRPEKKSSGA